MPPASGLSSEGPASAGGIPGPRDGFGMAGLHAGKTFGGRAVNNGGRGYLSDGDEVQQDWRRGVEWGF